MIKKENLIRNFGLATLLGIVAGCGMHIDKKTIGPSKTLSTSAPNESITFSFIRTQIIEPQCIRCHASGGKAADLPFSSYEDLMGTGTVQPGTPEQSVFYQMINDAQMPPRQPRLGEELVQAVFAWISEGAINN